MGIPKLGPVVAIDGPAGTGKSSVTHRLAEELHFVHIDTGALYRAIAYLTLEELKKNPNQEETVLAVRISKSVHLQFQRHAELNPANRIFGNGKDLTPVIRTAEVSMAASRISAIPEVRASLLALQRRLGCEGRSILEGRDIGTVIFPDADMKFFLTASVEERAKRRLIEMEASGVDAPSFEEVKQQISQRDEQDKNRKTAPLRKADDAIEIDTSTLTLDQVVEKMKTHLKEKIGSI